LNSIVNLISSRFCRCLSSDGSDLFLDLAGEEKLSNLVVVGVGRGNDAGIDGGIPDVLSEESLTNLVRVEAVSGLDDLVALAAHVKELLDGVVQDIAQVEQLDVLQLALGLLNDERKLVAHGGSGG